MDINHIKQTKIHIFCQIVSLIIIIEGYGIDGEWMPKIHRVYIIYFLEIVHAFIPVVTTE